MKSKKLLILIVAVALVLVVVVVLSSIFVVREVDPIYRDFAGNQISPPPEDAPTANNVLGFAKGKSITLLSKSKLADELNMAYPEWHVVGIVKSFPSILEVHFTKRVVVAQMSISTGEKVFLDNFGYVVDAPADTSNILDITSAISNREAKVWEKSKKFQFHYDVSNQRLEQLLDSVMALWQCKVEINQIPVVFGSKDLFTYDEFGSLVITTKVGTKIVILSPSNTAECSLAQRIINGISVYVDGSDDLQNPNTVITVFVDGNKISVDNNN